MVKKLLASAGDTRDCGRSLGWEDPRVGKIPWRRAWLLIPVFLPGESQGQRSLQGYSPLGCKESDMTEWVHTHTHTHTHTQGKPYTET